MIIYLDSARLLFAREREITLIRVRSSSHLFPRACSLFPTIGNSLAHSPTTCSTISPRELCTFPRKYNIIFICVTSWNIKNRWHSRSFKQSISDRMTQERIFTISLSLSVCLRNLIIYKKQNNIKLQNVHKDKINLRFFFNCLNEINQCCETTF